MRIVIIATGSRGDVEPYVALGAGLKKAGHYVRLVSHTNFAELILSQSLEFWPVEVDVQGIAQSQAMSDRLGGGNFLKVMSLMAKEAERSAHLLAKVGLSACLGMDIILTGLGGMYVGIALAEKLGLPLVQAHYTPFTPTRQFPSFLIPETPFQLGGSFNRFSYQLARQVMWQGFRRADTLSRRNELELPAASFWGPYNGKFAKQNPVLYGFSPSVIPQPPDWGDDNQITGYWFLEAGDDWAAPQPLVEFLQAGPPPVYVGFGSMSNSKPEVMTRLVLDALAKTNQRGIILSGWGGMRADDLPDTVFRLESAPFAWLFPRMAAVVHHGGAGTTAAGLRAGVPSIVTPVFADQPFWGRRVAQLGVGPSPIPLRKLTVDLLAQAIETALSDTAMRQRAAELGAKIQAEDGIANAISILEKIG
jgi:UDP:flavonoid glycosyltransferase YjiC (YdhE family)